MSATVENMAHAFTSTNDCDFDLVDKIIRILSSEHIFQYSLLTSLLVCELVVEFLALGDGRCAEIPRATASQIKISD
eukprot:jgi/Hompol1/959/HPOL_001564-RA